MAMTQEAAVRSYLLSLRDPNALRDQETINELKAKLEESDDPLERVQLRQQLIEAESPPLENYEDAFVEHAKAWAESQGVTVDAFEAEGVPGTVLRRAGFRTARGGRRRRTTRTTRTRTRVSADEVRQAIPTGVFTVKDLQEKSGASAAVVRRVVQEEVQAGVVSDEGPDPDHSGPGRAPTLYKR